MGQNETSQKKLTAKQERALDHLLCGETVTAAAKAAGVGRSTLHRWQAEDLTFQAAYNRRRHELQDAARARLLQLADQAMETVEGAVAGGDARTSLKVLDSLGLLEPPTIGLDSVEALEVRRKEMEAARGRDRFLTDLSSVW